MQNSLKKTLLDILVCPRDRQPLVIENDQLVCSHGHHYPVVSGIPVMLLDDVDVTHNAITDSIAQAKQNTFEITQNRKGVHPFVQKVIAATNGNLYVPLIDKLNAYPIPKIRLPKGSGQLLLDIGCNWGRWSISAAQAGYKAVGIDPSLEAILAAREVAEELGYTESVEFLVADARYLPFNDNVFDVVFSYSVRQHFSKENVHVTLAQISNILKPQGLCLIQMPNIYGVRSSYNNRKPEMHDERNIFRVRYWSIEELKEVFSRHIGESKLSVDGFFGLGIQFSDISILPLHYKAVVFSSEILRQLSLLFPPMLHLADSVYIASTKNA